MRVSTFTPETDQLGSGRCLVFQRVDLFIQMTERKFVTNPEFLKHDNHSMTQQTTSSKNSKATLDLTMVPK